MFIMMATQAMGTRFELVLRGEPETELRAMGEAVIDEIELWDQRLSRFRRDSLVSLINRDAATRPIRVDEDFLDLLRIAFDVSERSAGAFDISVGALMRARGFHDHAPSVTVHEEPRAGMSHIEVDWDAGAIRLTHPGVELDFGAIGKGFVIDLAMKQLRASSSVEAAMLHGGTSTVACLGSYVPGEPGWDVRIRDPRDVVDDPVVRLEDAALSVSGFHGRVIHDDDQLHGHVIDPRTGTSSRQAAYAAVIGPSATEADSWSTALLVLGHRPETMDPHWISIIDGDLEPADARNVSRCGVSTKQR